MKIEASLHTKLAITGVQGLDPIHVYLEDVRLGRGRITITCASDLWCAGWGAMGNRTVSEFFRQCDEGYLAENLSSVSRHIFDGEACRHDARKQVLTARRSREMSAREARELFDALPTTIADPASSAQLMARIYGDEWWFALPEKINPKYAHLCRIITTVQAALALHVCADKSEAAPA